jgi:hypothetical protein
MYIGDDQDYLDDNLDKLGEIGDYFVRRSRR